MRALREFWGKKGKSSKKKNPKKTWEGQFTHWYILLFINVLQGVKNNNSMEPIFLQALIFDFITLLYLVVQVELEKKETS